MFIGSRLKGVEVTWDGYLRWSRSQETIPTSPNAASTGTIPNQSPDTTSEEQPPLSFQQLSEMIATGNLTDVPFNRVIPEAISVCMRNLLYSSLMAYICSIFSLDL